MFGPNSGPPAPGSATRADPPGPFKALQHDGPMYLITDPERLDQGCWTGHHAVDGTAPPEFDLVFGRRVGRTERNILSQDHRERNHRAKAIVRSAAEALRLPGGAARVVLDWVDRATCAPPRERAVAALFAARAAPVGTLLGVLRGMGVLDDVEASDRFYPYRIMYRCGLAPPPPTAEDAARLYSVHRLPRTSAAFERRGMLDVLDRRVRDAIKSRAPPPGGSYRAVAVRALREIDGAAGGGWVDWTEVDRLW